MEYTKKTFDVSTGEETITPLSAEEVAQVEANIAKAQEQADLQATRAAEKAALLERLGITQDEAKLLLS
jgi:acyl-CoA reductase-like NAD-dependent aldehyde dehydrogenase